MALEIVKLFARVGADITEFRTKMREVTDTSRSTGQGMGKDLADGADEARRALGDLAGGAGGLGRVIGAGLQATTVIGGVTVAIKALREGVKAGIEAQDLAQEVDQIARAYERLAAVSLREGAPVLREATMGSMSDVAAAQMAMKLISMNLAKSNEDAAHLLNVATQLTRLSGGSIEGLLPLLTNQSALRLDEFLVSGDAVKRLKTRYMDAGMESGAAFMRAFVEEAQRTLAETGPVAPTMAEREAAQKANLKGLVAEHFAGSWTGQALGEVRSVWIDAKDMLADHLTKVIEGRAVYADLTAELERLRGQGALTDAEFKTMTGDVRLWQNSMIEGSMSAADLRAALEEMLNRAGELDRARTASALQTDLGNAAAKAEHLAILLGILDGQKIDIQVQLSVDRAIQGLGSGGFSLLNEITYTPRPTLPDASYLSDAYLYQPGGALYRPSAAETARQREAERAAARAQQAAARAQAEAEQKAREWQSFVSGLMQPTQVTDIDMMAAQAGMYGTALYPDKWDEAVRQFRMAEKGHSPWDIYQYEREFYGGQRMGEVNWEGLIAAGREELRYKEGQEALLQTAMQKMAEAGIGLEREQVAGLLGLPADYEATGAERATDFLRGFDGAAQDITTIVATEMRGQVEAWLQLGQDVANWFGDGFEAGVTPELVQAIINAILPGVLEAVGI